MEALTKRLNDLSLHDIALFALPISVALVFVHLARGRRRRTTRLKGPPSKSYIFGVHKELFGSDDVGVIYENWEKEYGPVFEAPSHLGGRVVVLCDPKAITHYYANDTFRYQQTPATRFFIGNFFGRGLLWAEGEDHKRQRRALSSAFSNAAIRRLTSVFYDSVYTLKTNWDSSFQNSSNDSLVHDVQQWMNYVSLDSIGNGGFSHDFGALKGKTSAIATAFDSFGTVKPSIPIMITFLLSPIIPIFGRIPNERTDVFVRIRESIAAIADDLLERARAEKAANMAESAADKSIIGTLIRAESASSSVRLSRDEVIAQNLLILAGYETTAISLTWTLIELSRNPEVQAKLREELSQLQGQDATYEQLTTGLPYLDAVACETLRVHPALSETTRKAQEDDVIPLSDPILDASGKLVDSIFVAKGTVVRVPIACLNRSELLWGERSKEYLPSRWLEEGVSKQKAAEIQGYRHLLTFIDGPRMCLGRHFALTEFKAVLSVLIRSYSFELPDGPGTKIESHRSILLRPKVAGQEGPKVPLIVRRIE
ncbi:cytochrome P450 [Lyophyllum atratum]|nr:cytochrome P450 [Lyophyllum atratum]